MDSAQFQRALTAFHQQRWSQASAAFTTLYQAHQTAELNRYLATSLYHDQQFLAAEQIAAEDDQAYLSDQSWFFQRLTIALKNQQFIFARQWCVLPETHAWEPAGLAQVAAAEEASRQALGATQRVIAKQFYHLGDADLAEQQRRIQRAHQLPLREFLRGVQYLLVDPFLQPLLRATLLEELSRLKLTQTVRFQWLDDQIYTIDTTQLGSVTASSAAQTALTYLTTQFAQTDPGLVTNVRQTLNLQLMLLYPFAAKVITAPEAWIDYLVGQADQTTITTEQAKQLKTWQKRLEKHLQDLFMAINNEKPEN
ncbi:hypothetical protein [Levilactobacillus acidifarinae]|uniref:TPR repeat-containing protein n=1 Tax=Levilactobacillus acidifarinae DSM 19394 = JCM 15949 TaxID=1423715 RepID=A0A0R1LPL3_9LACO|nr:hypothetical protein [Levilactobacillus acidifarinae]KRK94769.1 TPR repeat-containing protein [Levilactobacillus acidifarinae DSM 19394]GEO68528.1 hypothetical protein LAC03_04380 [Levilactobacillus acidifarinae]